jgi:hypothetical protein
MMRLFAVIAFAGLALSINSAAPQPYDTAWHAAMPSYYAALLASARGDADGTTRQLLLLGARLKELVSRTDAPAWATDTASGQPAIAAVAAAVDAARRQTLAREIGAAHASLEHVRYLLRDTRTRHGARTFDDAMTDYHEAMERLISRAGLHYEIVLTAEDYSAISEQAGRAAHAWSDIEAEAASEKSAPGWNAAAAKTRTLLAGLYNATSEHDADLAQTTAEALKAAYYELIASLARATS